VEKDFDSYYQTSLLPILEQLEAKRRAVVKNKIWLIVITLVAALVGFILVGTAVPVLAALALGCAIFLFAFNRKDGELIHAYKQEVLQKVASDFLDGVSYEPFSGLTEDTFIAIDLFNETPDRYKSEDLFSGIKDKTRYRFSEVHAEYKTEHTVTNSNGSTSSRTEWHDIFKGILFCADFNKHFSNTTLIKKDSFKLFGSSNRVKMEDPTFEETFDVYSESDQEARYLLTPAFVERFAALNQHWGQDICASFYNGELFIAIADHNDNFEPNQWNSLLNPEKIKSELRLLYELIGIIDSLDLNTRIWSKE
jgi:Protein of unknown function (DUF3137)